MKRFLFCILACCWIVGLTASSAELVPLTLKASEFTDQGSTESAEEHVSLTQNGKVGASFAFEAEGSYTIVVVAKGDMADGVWPKMEILVDNEKISTMDVRAPDWATYCVIQTIPAGIHEVGLAFINDYFEDGQDRNLHIDSLTIIPADGSPSVEPLTVEELTDKLEQARSELVEKTNERIRELRTRKIVIRVLSEEGKSVRGAKVTVKQKKHAFLFGTALCSQAFEEQFSEEETQQYLDYVKAHFNHAVPENAMKWEQMERERGKIRYETIDRIVKWCGENDISVRGHCVFWGEPNHIPAWVKALPDDNLRSTIGLRGRVIGGHFKGKIDEFDVNNEMLHASYFEDRLGKGVRRQMFHEVKAANPKAVLYVNDYNILNGVAVDAYKAHIEELLREGVPVGGIGVQGHFAEKVDADQVEAALDELATLNLPIKITEYDCWSEDEEVQRESLETLYRVAFAHPAVKGILMWGFWEKCHWKPQAAMLREDFSKKPAAEAFESLVYDEWWTEAEGKTSWKGYFDCDAFLGEYEVVVEGRDGLVGTTTLSLAAGDEPMDVELKLEQPVEESADADNASSNIVVVQDKSEPEDQSAEPRQWSFWRRSEK